MQARNCSPAFDCRPRVRAIYLPRCLGAERRKRDGLGSVWRTYLLRDMHKAYTSIAYVHVRE